VKAISDEVPRSCCGVGMSPAASAASSLRLDLERDPQAPSLARAAVRAFTEGSAIASVQTSTLTLLVSELVSNAVLHSDAPPASGIVVRASVPEQGVVRVEVIDAGSGFAVIPRDRVKSTGGGYGLFLVDEQASRWGVDREGGTRVWFELSSPSSASV
jgi:anti-sigma regulatory factor (Ser/Thr protein kinase)